MAFALFPATAYFGRMINYESPGLFFALLAFWGYCLFLKSGSNRAIWLMYAANLLGLLVCWEDYLFSFAIAFHWLLWGRKKGESSWKVLLLPASTVVVFAILMANILAVAGGLSANTFGGSMRWILQLRLGTQVNVGEYFTFLEFLSREFLALKELFTPIAVYGAGAWLVLLIIGRLRGARRREHFDWLVLSFLFYGVVYLLIFRQPAYLHNYMVYYMGPAVAFAAVIAARELILLCLAPKRWVKVAAAVLLGYLFLVAGAFEFFKLHENPTRCDWIDLGKYLRHYTDSGEAVILSWQGGNLYTEFYSDREIMRGITTVEQFQGALAEARNEVVVYMDTAKPAASAQLLRFLKDNYVSMPVMVNERHFVAFIVRVPRKCRRG
ncbi:hypothetical protein J7M28_00415 [bacterium]|nr:hypothetical protein [bacterium]